MSMALLWRDQGKPQQARQLLAPVYGWLKGRHARTEGGEGAAGGVVLNRRRERYCPNSASAVSTRASIGVCPNCESIRFASVRCWTARTRFFLIL